MHDNLRIVRWKSLFVLLCSVIAACEPEKAAVVPQEQERLQPIVLIFQGEIPNNLIKTFPTGLKSSSSKYSGEIAYMDAIGQMQTLQLSQGQKGDTLVIPAHQKYMPVRHLYQALDSYYFLFQEGDTAAITYKGFKPIIELANREAPSHEFAVQAEAPLSSLFLGELSQAVQHNVIPLAYIEDFFRKYGDSAEEEWRNIRRNGIEKAVKEHQELLQWVDSLSREKAISSQAAAFYRDYFFFKLQKAKVEAGHYDRKEAKKAVRGADTYLNAYLFYQDYVYAYAVHALGAEVKRIKTAHSNAPSYVEIYDLVAQDSSFSAEAKKYVLRTLLQQIFVSHSVEEAKDYKSRFLLKFPNDMLAESLAAKFNIEDANPQVLQLEDSIGASSSLEQVLESHRGKVVLLDLWASWCAPCIRNIPNSKKLSDKYEALSIIYLSKDEDPTKWKNAMRRFKLPALRSFRISNALTSQWLKEMEVNSIPRYMLYGKQGRLLHQNAPSPGAKSLEGLIEAALR